MLELNKKAKQMGFLNSEETPKASLEMKKNSNVDFTLFNSPRSLGETFLLMDHIGDKPKK